MVQMLMIAVALWQAGATLPATPQAAHVQGFITALNAGEAAFVKFMAAQALPTREPDQLKTMFARLNKRFGVFKTLKVGAASSDAISLIASHSEGTATVTFSFEKAAPFRISNIFVEVN